MSDLMRLSKELRDYQKALKDFEEGTEIEGLDRIEIGVKFGQGSRFSFRTRNKEFRQAIIDVLKRAIQETIFEIKNMDL